jgi:DNA-binding Lrp family transcriptional regulator
MKNISPQRVTSVHASRRYLALHWYSLKTPGVKVVEVFGSRQVCQMPGELNGESVIFLKVTPGYVEKTISSAKGKPNVTQVEPVFGRHDVAIRGTFRDLAELHRFQASLLNDYVRGVQAYPAAQEFVKIKSNGQPVSAWVLVRTNDPQRVASELKKTPGIEGLIGTTGNFDLLARFGVGERDELMTTVLKKIQTIQGVRATETLPSFANAM